MITDLRERFEQARDAATAAWSKFLHAQAYREAVEVQYRQAKTEEKVALTEYNKAKRLRESALDALIDAEVAISDESE